ncbi:hypothetical protein OKW41_009177 [Paraburkholderia sp. UCT70]
MSGLAVAVFSVLKCLGLRQSQRSVQCCDFVAYQTAAGGLNVVRRTDLEFLSELLSAQLGDCVVQRRATCSSSLDRTLSIGNGRAAFG